MNFDYFLPTRILFGNGRLNDLPHMALPGKRALLVTSQGQSMKRLGYIERVSRLLNDAGVEVFLFDGVQSNPVIANVMDGRDLAVRCQCEFVVGLGGGSTLDCAKAIAVMAKNQEYGIWDYIGLTDKGNALFVPTVGSDIMLPGRIKTGFGYKRINGALPIIAITTTAGTGSECDPWTVTTNTESKDKLGIGGSETYPWLAIVDPELMASVPGRFTAFQGFDALFHCIEAYFGVVGNPISAAFARMGIESVRKYLVRAINDGDDAEAREGMAFANLMGGFTLSGPGTTSEHAIAQAIAGSAHDLPHGASLILLSDAYFSFFARRGIRSLAEIGQMLGEDVDSLPADQRPMAAVYALRRLRKECGIDQIKMSDWNVNPEDFPMIAHKAKSTGMNLFRKDPIMLDESDVVQILEASYYGG